LVLAEDVSFASVDDQTTDRPQVADASSRDAKAASSAGTDMSPLDKLVGVPGDTVHRLTGAWDYEYPPADARRLIADFRDYVDHDTKRVVARLGLLDGNEWWLGFLFDGDLILVNGVPEGDGGFYAVHDDELTTSGAHNTGLVTYRWSLDGDKLTLTALEECSIEGSAKTSCTHQRRHMDPMMRMVTENTFVRSADEATY
jgi:hypothetical protein